MRTIGTHVHPPSISPSVYVGYHQLSITNTCLPDEDGFESTTIAYDPDSLSTWRCINNQGMPIDKGKRIDFRDFYDPPSNAEMESECRGFWANKDNRPWTTFLPKGTEIAAAPYFVLPTGLSTLKPRWKDMGCTAFQYVQFFFGVADPPQILSKVSAI